MFYADVSTGAKLAMMIGLIGGSVGAGYVARRIGLGERIARALMYFVITVPYAVVGLLAIWALEFSAELSLLPLFGLLIMTAGIAAGMAIARWLRMPPFTAGAFVLAAGASNLGFTMGGFVNFVIFGKQGLAVAAMYTLFWDFGMLLVLYPVARHYGQGARQSFWRLLVANFADVRSLPALAAFAGLTLNRFGVHPPPVIDRLRVVEIGMVGGAIVAFFVTGLRLHLGHLRLHKWLYPIVAAVKFLLMPAVAAALVGAMWLIGRPLIHPASAPAWKVVLVQASTPTAIYAVVISNLFRLDDRFASIMFVVNTAIYLLVVVPVVVMLFQ